MPVTLRRTPRLPLSLALALVLSAAAAHPQEPAKKPADTPAKSDPKAAEPPVAKLPDGTFRWLGTPLDGTGERVTLTPQELDKLLEQVDQLKKQLAARKPAPPSGCALRGKVAKRGEQLVAVLKASYTFRTTQPQTAIALGGRRAFLVSASLDGKKLPVLEPTEDGFAVLVESAGDHALALELEAPVTARGAKAELGFELGLPRAAITTLILDRPGPDVKRVNLTTRTPDPAQPARPPDPRRASVDLKQLTPAPDQEAGYALGPVDSLEVTWDPPAAAQPADQVQSAELDVAVVFTEGVVETTAKVKFRGPAREWQLVAPAGADLSVDRAAGAEAGATQPAVVTKPGDPNKPVWKIDFPAGSPASDWVVTAVTRQPRPKPEDPAHAGPFSVGPFTALDVLRQTGTVRVTAGPHTRFAFRHGPDLRRTEPAGPPEEDVTAAFFRLTTGPTGPTPADANAYLLSVEARAQGGAVKATPAYKLTLTEAGWRVRAEVKVSPIRAEVGEVSLDVPADWLGLEASPPELVEGVQQGDPREGFWAATAARAVGGLRVPVVVRLAASHKQPFDLLLTATVPVEPTDAAAAVLLPRFPPVTDRGVSVAEQDTSVTASVPEGLDVRGETRDRNGEYASWGTPLDPVREAGGRATRAVTAVAGKAEGGLSRVLLAWHPYRPELTAEVRAEVTLRDRQLDVTQHVTLRSPEGLPRAVRFRGSPALAGLRAAPASGPPLDPAGPGEWVLTPAPDARDVSFTASYALPVPRAADESLPAEVPVALLWPVAATRTETSVRVWSNTTSGRVVTTPSPGWRELPAEPAPERDALPLLTLAASGAEPLVLEARPSADGGAISVWADRGLVEAWGADDGATSYRARFLLRRWLVPAVEVRLPGPLAGPNPEFLRDGQRIDVSAVPGGADGRSFRVPLPAARAGAAAVLEVRYQLPPARGRTGESAYLPPTLPSVAFAGPIKWQVTVPDGTVPLLTGGATAEFRWRVRPVGFGPASPDTAESLDWWFRTGEEVSVADGSGEAVTARQTAPAAVSLYRAPRTGFVIVCSVAAFVVVLILSRFPRAALGPAVAVAGAAAGLAAVFYPHPAAQVAGACQPGFAAAAGVLVLLGVARWSYRRRLARMPGFTQLPPEPSPPAGPLPSSARNRATPVGSGRAPVAPAGG
jgi:hypothetical protein